MRKQIVGGVVGILIGMLLVTATPSKAQVGYHEALYALPGIRVELQRIANALDRLVSIQSGANRQTQAERNK